MNEEIVREHLGTLIAIEEAFRRYRKDVSQYHVDQYHGILGQLWLMGKLELPGGLDIPNEKRKTLGYRPNLGGAGMSHRGPLVSLTPELGCDRGVFLEAIGRAIEYVRSVLPEQPGNEGKGGDT